LPDCLTTLLSNLFLHRAWYFCLMIIRTPFLPLLLAGLLLLFGGLAWWAFSPSQALGDAVPDDALLTLDSPVLQDAVTEQVRQNEMPLTFVPVFMQARQALERPLLAVFDTTQMRRLLAHKDIRYSLHTTSKSNLDFIFYIPTITADEPLLAKLNQPNPDRFRVLTRTFNNEKVHELIGLSNESFGHWLITDAGLIGSASGVLLENVIRKRHRPHWRFGTDNQALESGQIARLSVQPDVVRQLFEADNNSLVRLFLPKHLNLRFRQADTRTHLVGYATDDIADRRAVSNLFSGQTPVRIGSAALIPQSTATLYHLGLTDAPRFGKQIRDLLKSNATGMLKTRLENIEPAAEQVFDALSHDVLLCQMEATTGAKRQVLVLSATNTPALSAAMQQVARLAGATKPQPTRTFLGHKLLRLSADELPASLFSGLFAGFRETWLTQHGKNLILANGEEVMQDYLQQISRRATWASNLRQTVLLKNIMRSANFTAFVRVNRAESPLPDGWPPAWRDLVGNTLPNLENMVYQASYGNNQIASTLILGRTTRRASQAVLNKLLLRKNVAFNAPLIAAPVVTGNLHDGSAQFYAQNQAGQFVLVTPDGQKIVQDSTDGPIRSNVVATDFLNNGRLQYLFMTDHTLYIADPIQDRQQQSVRLRAVRLPSGLDPSFLALPRNNRQRNLVALAAHQSGHIYALDRKSRAFVRLAKAAKPGPLLLPFQVLETANGMDILALQADGTLNRWHDTGQQADHYPANIGIEGVRYPFVSPALQPASGSRVEMVTADGELMQLNANGLIASRNQLYRPVRSGSFRLFPDVQQHDWLLLLTTDTEVAVLDKQGNKKFEIRGLQPQNSTVQYHRLGGGVAVISVKSGSFTTLFTPEGRAITDRPIPSDFPVTLQLDEQTNELYVLSGVAKAVQLFSIRLK
jgi:hypothetical protein